MHDKQYREFKSGLAKEQFNQDLIERMRKAGKPIPESLLPKPEAGADDMAAVAMALHLAGKRPATKEGIIKLPTIHQTAWNHKHYTLK